MNCPQCEVPMHEFNLGDDVIQECRSCRGLWLEKGQLDSLKDEVLPEMGWVDMDLLQEQLDFKAVADVLMCPQCRSVALTTIQDRKRKAEFCLCPQCQGTWLGTGQFLSLIDLLLEEANNKSASELAVISLQQAKELLTDSDSNLSEWQGLKSVLLLLKDRIFVENPKLKSVLVGIQKSLPL